ncbi:MAG: PQQ-like beta-propeller repeat protein [Bacteroidales bacterium]|nr:PQQ-like beta-propeller repeat protein [Bacteroidales bacterium]MDP3003150.1 PQQ-like beta-propeller repeat protein [Bacteroidales bacterium]
MKSIFPKLLLSLLFCTTSVTIVYCQLYEWRGPDRTGIYNETGLQKKWPVGGPKLLWETVGMGDGYSSATVTNDAVYVTGRKDSSDVLIALTLDGKKKWETVYGKAWMANHTGSRCIPTYYNGNLFLVSGSGDIVCVGSDGKIKWSKNHYRLYESKPLMFGISESPLVVDNMVIASPGGKKASLVAFNINDGKVVWEAESLNEEPQYVNPKLIEYAGGKMIVTVMGAVIFAVDAKDGKILWKVNYASVNAATGKVMKNHATTPIYKDGYILIANGYNWVALKLKLSGDGNSAEIVWENRNFDPQLGGIVLLGNNIYGTNHMSKPVDTWVCVDWNTGKTLWTSKWYSKGSIISADGMLYLYEEKSGHVALANPDPAKLDIISEFQITKGEGPFWAHPVISKGRLYIRHGDVLMVYLIK